MSSVPSLSRQQFEDLRREYKARNEEDLSADLDTFIDILQTVEICPRDDPRSAIELFRMVDFNADGMVSWEEVSTFLIEMTLNDMRVKPHESIKPYGCVSVIAKEESVVWMGFVAKDKLVVVDRIGRLSFLNPVTLVTLGSVIVPALKGIQIFNVEYVSMTDVYIVTGADCMLHVITQGQLLDDVHCYSMRLDTTSYQVRWHNTLKRLFVATRLGTVQEYEAHYEIARPLTLSGAVHHTIHTDTIRDFVFIEHQSKMISCGMDKKVFLYDVETRENILIGQHKSGVTHVANSDYYRYTVSIGFESEACAWMPDVARRHPIPLRDVSHPHSGTLVGVHTVENSPQIVTGDEYGLIKIWDTRQFKCVQSLRMGEVPDLLLTDTSAFIEPKHRMDRLLYSPNSNEVIGTYRKHLYVHGYDKGNDPTIANQNRIQAVYYSSVAGVILTCTSNEVLVWDASYGVVENVFKNITKADITTICGDPQGRRFYLGTMTGFAQGHSLRTGIVTFCEKSHKSEVTCLAYILANRMLVTTGTDGFVTVYSETESTLQKYFLHVGGGVGASLYLPHIGLLLTGGAYGTLAALDPLRPPRTEVPVHRPPAECLDFVKPEDRIVHAMCDLDTLPLAAVAYGNGSIAVWGLPPLEDPFRVLATWSTVPAVPLETSQSSPTSIVQTLAFSRKTHRIYAGDDTGCVICWTLCEFLQETRLRPVSDDKLVQYLPESFQTPKRSFPVTISWQAHTSEVAYLELIDELDRVVTSGDDMRVRIWSAMDGSPLTELSQGRTKEGSAGNFLPPPNVSPKDTSRLSRVATMQRKAQPLIPSPTHKGTGRRAQPQTSMTQLVSVKAHKGLGSVGGFTWGTDLKSCPEAAAFFGTSYCRHKVGLSKVPSLQRTPNILANYLGESFANEDETSTPPRHGDKKGPFGAKKCRSPSRSASHTDEQECTEGEREGDEICPNIDYLNQTHMNRRRECGKVKMTTTRTTAFKAPPPIINARQLLPRPPQGRPHPPEPPKIFFPDFKTLLKCPKQTTTIETRTWVTKSVLEDEKVSRPVTQPYLTRPTRQFAVPFAPPPAERVCHGRAPLRAPTKKKREDVEMKLESKSEALRAQYVRARKKVGAMPPVLVCEKEVEVPNNPLRHAIFEAVFETLFLPEDEAMKKGKSVMNSKQ